MALKVGEIGKIINVNAAFDLSGNTDLEINFTKPDLSTLTVNKAGGVSAPAVDFTDPDTGEVFPAHIPVRPSHYKCAQTGAVLPVENPDIAKPLVGINLMNANLAGLNLSHADLTGANTAGADLFGADLTGAILRANLNPNVGRPLGAILKGAILTGVDLTGIDLTGIDPP